MKLLPAKPSVPPYLHLGAVWLALPAAEARDNTCVHHIEAEWRKICGQITVRPKMLHALIRRMDEREADPSYTDAPHEIYYTITDGGRNRSSINFYF